MKICLACSHGGHLTETLQIMEAFSGQEVFFVTYNSARDEEVKKTARAHFTKNIGTSIYRMLLAFPWALRILLRERPDVVLSLGAEIALPFFLLAKVLRIKTIFIESWCRVENLSLTGCLLYRVADVFYVQWPQMLEICGSRAQYKGAVI